MLIKQNKFNKKTDYGCAVVVMPPCRRMINFRSNKYDVPEKYGKKGSYFLNFPFTAFSFVYQKSNGAFQLIGLRVAFARQSDCERLYIPALCNVSEYGEVCIELPVQYYANLTEALKAGVKAFWASTFSEDHGAICDYYEDTILGSLDKWQQKTKLKPKWTPGRVLKGLPSESAYKEFYWPEYDHPYIENER